MAGIHIAAVGGLFLTAICYLGMNKGIFAGRGSDGKKGTDDSASRSLYGMEFWILMAVALILRLILAYYKQGFDTDINCFAYWANRMYEVGPAKFYDPEIFSDYPPGYLYLLWIVGAISSALDLAYRSGAHLVVVKLPSIICDLLTGWLIYREAYKRLGRTEAHFVEAAYLFQPMILLNSVVWGQVDSVYTLFVLLTVLFLSEEKYLRAYLFFAIGILIKPQTLIFTPVLLVAVWRYVFGVKKPFRINWKRFLETLAKGIGAITVLLLMMAPFGLKKVLELYVETMGSYPYATVNGYNFWGMIGKCWASQDTLFIGLSIKTWGTIAILLIVFFTFFISYKNLEDDRLYAILASFIIVTMFTFSVRMHERYVYPAFALLLLAYLWRPGKHIMVVAAGMAMANFYNSAYVLEFYDPMNFNSKHPVIVTVSAFSVCMAVYLYWVIARYYGKNAKKNLAADAFVKRKTEKEVTEHPLEEIKHFGIQLPLPEIRPEASEKKLVLARMDWILMISITLFYSCFALRDLGDGKMPQTSYEMQSGDVLEFEFPYDVNPVAVNYLIAPWHDRHFRQLGYAEGQWVQMGEDLFFDSVFTWKKVDLFTQTNRIRLELVENQASILELVFEDVDGNRILPVNASQYPELFDEQALCPDEFTFRNSMYFDEIYHGRTAYEMVHGMTNYENTHPPLGKFIISIGVRIFGMTPFGWRIMGTLFGIFMLPVMYLFAKKMTDDTLLASVACAVFAFDFMHFTQTRIATIDVYITFFIILMYYLMYCYCKNSFYDKPLKEAWRPLAFCGLTMGLGIASKWTGVYAGAGLAVIFFVNLYNRYREYRYALVHRSRKGKDKQADTGSISNREVAEKFPEYVKKLTLFCLIVFVAVPALIYLLAYIPFKGYSEAGLLKRMLDNQSSMFSYHSGLDATHPYSSPWYQWLTMYRPVWYYSHIYANGLREGISAFGNPLVWWMGIPAFLYTLYLMIFKRDRQALFLAVGYLAQYLPWTLVTRITFMYHYFPCVPFVVLMIVKCLADLRTKMSKKAFTTLCIAYTLLVFVLFLLFYPVLSGEPVTVEYVNRWLRWRDSWVLISG